jgi:type 1 glutamine amidotransferase
MNNKFQITRLLLLLIAIFTFTSYSSVEASTRKKSVIKTLIVSGQNNHYWKNSTPIFKKILEDAGVFNVDVATSPEKGGDMSTFNPEFSNYDVVVLDYNGDMWNEQTKNNFEKYVLEGGGVVVIHAADNSFSEWDEYNKIIGLGGWGKRNETSGPYVYWKDGKAFYDYSVGKGGGHGKQREYTVNSKAPKHPVMKGIPMVWMHAQDELYDRLRGPAKNLEILATSQSDKASNGSGREEPVLMTIKYGKGRIFHTVLGHVGKEQTIAVQCAGFVYTLQRGTEWAATGKVKQAVPEKWPTETETLLFEQYNITGN